MHILVSLKVENNTKPVMSPTPSENSFTAPVYTNPPVYETNTFMSSSDSAAVSVFFPSVSASPHDSCLPSGIGPLYDPRWDIWDSVSQIANDQNASLEQHTPSVRCFSMFEVFIQEFTEHI
jgi:hypothetical protein